MPEPPLPARSPLRRRGNNVDHTNTTTPPESPMGATGPASKRDHAMNELLSSEKSYAADLAIVRQVHIPLALGQPIQINDTLLTSQVDAPMDADDVKIIFSNIEEVAQFADKFHLALKDAVDQDAVGQLFLDSCAEMERPYKVYIAKHESAAMHLHNLPASTELSAYHAQTRTIASSMSHAWDLNSMLIKPVQRLLKYPLLLGTIYDETPSGHPDKDNLRRARDAVQELAHNVNEERRRLDLVKDLLKRDSRDSPTTLRIKGLKPPGGPETDEARRIVNYHKQLAELEEFVGSLAHSSTEWCKTVAESSIALKSFADVFGKVVGLSGDLGSEAFDAFVKTLDNEIIPMAASLSKSLFATFLSPLESLLETLSGPLHLLDTLQNHLWPLHNHLLHMPLSAKNRPPPELIKASAEYVALRGKLAEEIPIYMSMANRVLAGCVVRLSRVQREYYHQVHSAWKALWAVLPVEGEPLETGNAIKAWWDKWQDVDVLVTHLRIVQQIDLPPTPAVPTHAESVERSRTSGSSTTSASPTSTAVNSMLSSLEPRLAPNRYRSSKESIKSKESTSPKSTSQSFVKFKGRRSLTEYEYDIGYDYVKKPAALDSLHPGTSPTSPTSPVKKSRSKSSMSLKRPSTSSGGSPTSDLSRRLSFRRKTSDSSLKERVAHERSAEGRRSDVLYCARSVYAFEIPPDPRTPPGKKAKPPVYVYDGYPFLTLQADAEVLEVILNAGHPRDHLSKGLKLYVDDGESSEPDKLLLVRRKVPKTTRHKDKTGDADVGWALASYLQAV
ncbi:hypothetical protein CYLTODRAFT_440784 [Cylindrobasidium torrendii FP15055 ss-10]|uniref:DH domain-containing protein n=1 Tax=Cylindrobasidium torrendii FP15055 ss-10 TaxID=1314674 RepID=A0A0D7BRH8_9AGAR|nr:hypothetical protein CYLTODRAFT_440784 [Cylindrobasidium torrendii FP15055 ss-10]